MPDDRSLMTAAQLPLECSNNNRATVLSLQRLQTQNRPLLFNFEATTNSREHPQYKCKISIFWLIWQGIFTSIILMKNSDLYVIQKKPKPYCTPCDQSL